MAPIAAFIVSMRDGTVRSQGENAREVLEDDLVMKVDAKVMQEELEIANEAVQELSTKETPVDGKLVVAEEISQGHVTWKSYKLFLSSLGGDHPILFYFLWLCGFLLSDSIRTSQTWFLGYWGSQYETHDPSEVAVRL